MNRGDEQSEKPSIKYPITLLMLNHCEQSIWTHNHKVHQADLELNLSYLNKDHTMAISLVELRLWP